MKFIACADIHLSDKCPKSRKGNYFKQILVKFEYILKRTQKTDSKLLVIAGDFFDTTKAKYKVTNKIQHDLNYHVSGLDNTPLGILETAGAISILNNKTTITIGGVTFIGAGWNEKPKEQADVLVIHRMIVKKGELWAGQTNYSTAHAILRKYPWAKCIISGDNHLPHSLRTKNKLQINCGSMVRSTKAQINYQPRCWIIDTEKWETKPIKIKCLASDDVFDMNQIEIDETKDDAKREAEEKIAAFIDTLPNTEKEKPNYKSILSNVIDQTKPKKNVMNIINQTMERINT